MMKNLIKNTAVIVTAGILLFSLYKINETRNKIQDIENIRKESTEILKQQEQLWRDKALQLEQAKKEVEQLEKQARTKAEELQTQIELLRANYEEKLSAEKYYWQDQFEKFRAQDLEHMQNEISIFLKQAQDFMSDGKYIEAVKYFSKVLALEPSHEEAIKGLNQANSLITEDIGINQIIKDLEKAVAQLKKRDVQQIETLRKDSEEYKKNYLVLKEQLESEKKMRLEIIETRRTLEKRLAEKSKEWAGEKTRLEQSITSLEKDKQEYLRLKEQVKIDMDSLRKDYEQKFQQIQKESEEKTAQAYKESDAKTNQINQQWQIYVDKLEQEKIKLAEELALLRSRLKAAEESSEQKVIAERAVWQERFEALQSPVNPTLLSQEPAADSPASVQVNLEVLEESAKNADRKKEALKILDQAMDFIQKEDYHTAESLLVKSSNLDPQNNTIKNILLKIRALESLEQKN